MSQKSTGETADSLAPGRTIGDYEIESVAASGGMGIVYSAKQRSLGRRVALKVIRSEIAADPDYRARFMRESRQAASVDHPHVVSVYEVGNDEGRLFLAMQWIEGTDLNELIRRRRRLPPDQAVRITLQLAGALQAVHDAGLIHRDVKPANVLLRQVGGEDHTYLTDFGVARPLYSEEKFTKSGVAVGTIGYMAPEQIQGLKPVPQTDIYALGCLFFRLLTGSPPFSADNELALAWAHLHKPRPAASAKLPELGTRYDEFIAMALAIEPSDRITSSRAFATALKALKAQPPSHATPQLTAADTYGADPGRSGPVTTPRTLEYVDRRPAPTALYPPYPRAQPSNSAPEPSPRRRYWWWTATILTAVGCAAVAALVLTALSHTDTPRAQPNGPAVTTPGPFPPATAPTGTDNAGFHTGPGCSDDPHSPLPGCSDAPTLPVGAKKFPCAHGEVVDLRTTSCSLASQVVARYAGDGLLVVSDPATSRKYVFSCMTGGAGTTRQRICRAIGRDRRELYVRWG